jgi:DNA polymerase III delta subunit
MIVVLFGTDSYRRALKVRELIAAYRKKHAEVDLLTVDFRDDPETWIRARDFLRQPSMFVDSKVLVVVEPAASGISEIKPTHEWREAIEDAIGAKGTVIIFTSEYDPADFFPFLRGPKVERQEFKELTGRLLETFVVRELNARGLALELSAQNLFLTYLSALPDRSARAVSELERMALAGFASPVTYGELAQLIAWAPSEGMFRGAYLVGSDALPLARLAALEGLLLEGEAPARLFNLIAFQVGGAAAAALSGYDIAVKSGRLEYEEALTDFAVSAPGVAAVTRAEFFVRDAM